MSAICPYRCTGSSARVLGPIAAAAASRIEAVVARGDVSHDRLAARLGYGLECGDEGGGGNDDLVAGLDPDRNHAEPQSIQPARDADAVIDFAVFGKGPLEGCDSRPVREATSVKQFCDLVQQPFLQRAMGVRKIEKRHAGAGFRSPMRRHVLEPSHAPPGPLPPVRPASEPATYAVDRNVARRALHPNGGCGAEGHDRT